MRLVTIKISTALIFLFSGARAEIASPINIQDCTFGEIYQSSNIGCSLHVTNSSDQSINLTIDAVGERDRPKHEKLFMAAGASMKLPVALDLTEAGGVTQRRFKLKVVGSTEPATYAKASGYVQSLLDDPRPTLDLGSVSESSIRTYKKFNIPSGSRGLWKFENAHAENAAIESKIEDGGSAVGVRFRRDVFFGPHREKLVLDTNSKLQKQIVLTVTGDIQGDVVPDVNSFSWGVIRGANSSESTIRLRSKSGRKFAIKSVSIGGVPGAVETNKCSGSLDSCVELNVTIDKSADLGKFDGVVKVNLDGQTRPLFIDFWGLKVSEKTEIRELDSNLKESTSASSVPASAQSREPNIVDALRGAVVQTDSTASIELPSLPGAGPLLRWSVKNDDVVFGYVVERSATEVGPYKRLNAAVIRAQHLGTDLSAYQWRDITAEKGHTYWYKIIQLTNDGLRRQLVAPHSAKSR